MAQDTDLATLRQVADLLLALESELRRQGLWEAEPPAPERLASSVPFCHDTLELQQWLQWVFVPRMGELVEQGGPLPGGSGIAPIAEYVFGQMAAETDELVRLLAEFDRVLTQH